MSKFSWREGYHASNIDLTRRSHACFIFCRVSHMPALASSPQARVLPRSSCGDLGQRCTVVNGCFVQCRHLARGSRSRLRLVTGQSVDSTRAAASAATTQPLPGVKYSFLQGVQVLDADGYAVDLASLLPPSAAAITVLVFLTHYADLSSWELAQQLVKALPTLEAQGAKLVAVGLGEPVQARRFAEILSFPVDILFSDPNGAGHTALGFSPGFAPDADVSAYAKLLPMLAGIGSPGTLQEVIRGYVGDRSAEPIFAGTQLGRAFDTLGGGYQRPFELATLRLQNMAGILPKWSELSPRDERLLTQQGGALVLRGTETVFRHDDSGILKYVSVKALLAAAQQPVALPAPAL